MLLAQRVRLGPAGDFGDLVPLASKAADVMPYEQPDLWPRSAAPPPWRPPRPLSAGNGQAAEQGRRSRNRAAYRERRKVERVMSVAKRRCSQVLTARLEPTQQARALLADIGYDVQRLVILGCSS